MNALPIFDGNRPVKYIEAELERTENDILERKAIRGRFMDSKENLVGWLGVCEAGEIGLAIDGPIICGEKPSVRRNIRRGPDIALKMAVHSSFAWSRPACRNGRTGEI